MMKQLLAIAAVGFFGWDTLLSQESAPPAGLSPEEFDRIFSLCKLKPQESSWDKLPWETNLWRAVERASREKKLLLLWSAGGGGHPLGMC